MQLLLVNLLTDVAPAMAMALRPPARMSLAKLANEGPEASLGQLLSRQIAMRAAVTALGASAAWGIARLTGSRTGANTVGLVALGRDAARSDADFRRAQPPGGRNGRRLGSDPRCHHSNPLPESRRRVPPLGPLGWIIALGDSVAATGAANALPDFFERMRARPPGGVVSQGPPVLATWTRRARTRAAVTAVTARERTRRPGADFRRNPRR